MDKVWQEVLSGHHVVVTGAGDLASPPDDVFAVRVDCEGHSSPLGPLLEAHRQVDRALGDDRLLRTSSGAHPRVRKQTLAGLRYRVLGDASERESSTLLEALDRLAMSVPESSAALVFEHADAAHSGVLRALAAMVGPDGHVQLPIVVTFRAERLEGAGAQLVERVERGDGVHIALTRASGDVDLDDDAPSASMDGGSPPPTGPEAPATRADAPDATSADVDLDALPREVLRTLRACALVGLTFESELVADMLGSPHQRVLEILQHAIDVGVPIEDLGECRFRLPDRLGKRLVHSITPSLAASWHRGLADLLSASAVPDESVDSAWAPVRPTYPVDAPPPSGMFSSLTRPHQASRPAFEPRRSAPSVPSRAPEHAGVARAATVPDVDPAEIKRAQVAQRTDTGPNAPPVDPGGSTRAAAKRTDGKAVDVGAAGIELGRPVRRGPTRVPVSASVRGDRVTNGLPSHSATPGSAEPVDRRGRRSRQSRLVDDARAAQHALAASQPDRAAAHFLSASHQAALSGAYEVALGFAMQGLQLIENQPRTDSRRHLRVLLMTEVGRIQAAAAGPHGEFTLDAALESLDTARDLIEDGDPVELTTEIAALTANVCYDIGDDDTLERALEELSDASRMLMDADRPVEAARLLNEQAAVWVRLGDYPRANHLLEQSREVFETNADHNDAAYLELAETNHLIARLTLHVEPKAGREEDAFAAGVHRAREAEEAYEALELPRELGRVKETLGRIYLRAGDLDAAANHLEEALKLQRQLGDLIGLARTSGALAELNGERDRLPEALALLHQSTRLNLEKGSPLGLLANRQLAEQLGDRVKTPEDRSALEAVANLIQRAEAILEKNQASREAHAAD